MYSKRNKLIKRTVNAGSITVVKRSVVPDEFGVDRIVSSTIDVHDANIDLPDPSTFSIDNCIRTGKNLEQVNCKLPKVDLLDFTDKHAAKLVDVIDNDTEYNNTKTE